MAELRFGASLETTRRPLLHRPGVRARGTAARGPAKAAVIASGLMGSISGSAIANVVTSVFVAVGLVTISYPGFLAEAVGFAPMLLAPTINWTKRRRERRAQAALA